MGTMDFGEVKTDEKIGRYLEAKRDIKQGEVLFTEDALMTGPYGDTHYSICITCYRMILDSDKINICNGCKWPTCSETCEKAAIHAKYECRVFKNAKVKPTKEPQVYFNLTVMRCMMLKEANAKKFELLLKLYQGQGKKKLMAPAYIADFVFKKCNKKEFDSDLLAKVEIICRTHAFGTTDRLAMQAEPRMAMLMFYGPGLMSHSCSPNTSYTRIENPDNTFSIKVWAALDIKAGDKITGQWFDITRPTAERRFHFQDVYQYTCTCARCQDPTDLGTYYGAIKCTKCPNGYMISTDMSKGSDAEWKCEGCDNKVHYRGCTVPIETTIWEEVFKSCEEEEFEKILETHCGPSLHPNHWLMMDCRQEIVKRMYSFIATVKPPEKVLELAQKMLDYCNILKIRVDMIYPGHNRLQARHQLYTRYAEALLKGESPESDAEIDKIEELIRKGEEMNIFAQAG